MTFHSLVCSEYRDKNIVQPQWQGFKKGLFGTGLFMIKLSGNGEVFLNAYGGIIQRELVADEKIIIDNYRLVAFNENMSYRVTKFGGLKTTILGGDGLVLHTFRLRICNNWEYHLLDS